MSSNSTENATMANPIDRLIEFDADVLDCKNMAGSTAEIVEKKDKIIKALNDKTIRQQKMLEYAESEYGKIEQKVTKLEKERDDYLKSYQQSISGKQKDAQNNVLLRTENRELKTKRNQLQQDIKALETKNKELTNSLSLQQQRGRERVQTMEHNMKVQAGKFKSLETRVQNAERAHQESLNSFEQQIKLKEEQYRKSLGQQELQCGQHQANWSGETKTWKKQYEGLLIKYDKQTLQCNELVQAGSQRRTHVPLEDESQIARAFGELNAEVRDWCVDVWQDVRPENIPVRFNDFPLAAEGESPEFETDEMWLLIALVWEYLMLYIFNGENPQEVLDLWTDIETAKHIKALERRVHKMQKPNTANEWRSFTVQCLHPESSPNSSPRNADLVKSFQCWLADLFSLEAKSDKISTCIQRFENEVVGKAVSFSLLLRKRSGHIYMHMPATNIVIRDWQKRVADGAGVPKLELDVVPELCKAETSEMVTDKRLRVLMQSYKHCIVRGT